MQLMMALKRAEIDIVIIIILKRFFVVQNFRKALKIGSISFDLSSLEKG